jgi:hypothetical protein
MHPNGVGLAGARVPVILRQASLGYASIYLLVFFRSLLLLGLYLHGGLSLRAAQGEIRGLTKDLSPDSELVAYFWMRRPSFVVMDGPDKTWVSAEGTIFDGDERTLALYERQSGKRVKYIVLPQLGHMQSPPGFFRNAGKTYRLVSDRWTNKRATLFGFNLGGEIPGYRYALYRLVGA